MCSSKGNGVETTRNASGHVKPSNGIFSDCLTELRAPSEPNKYLPKIFSPELKVAETPSGVCSTALTLVPNRRSTESLPLI